jgi:regulator of replication initiation timing
MSSIERPEESNPFLVTAKFIFADNQPNDNGMGIEFEEFPAVAASAINMPVKMRYLGEGIGNHAGSIPIGHIIHMEIEDEPLSEVKRLIGTAALYADEYEDEIGFLFQAFAENKAPGISWELAYSDSIVKDGIHWLKGIITKAATFVKFPAYGKRTALLALASDSNLSDEELDEELLKLTKASSTDTGGNKVELEELQKRIEELMAALSAKDAEIADIRSQHDSIVEENSTLKDQMAAIQKNARVEERARKWVEAGFTFSEDAEKATEKREFLASLDDSLFEIYLSDLVAAKGTQKPPAEASASRNTDGIPKPEITDQDEEISLEELRLALRTAARS